MSSRIVAISSLLIVGAMSALPAAGSEERVIEDDEGRIVTVPVETPEHLRNPWPEEMEQRFRSHRDRFIRQYVGKSGVNTALENEKQGYPPTMLAFCAGDRDAAIAALQAEDAMARNHQHTEGIDYYWCFTLKGQMRKYFFFGQYLDAAYRQRMQAGGTAWAATDPRPNTELVLLAGSSDPEVAAYATAAMEQMWRDEDGLEALAAAAQAEYEADPQAHQAHLKQKFADFIRANAAALGGEQPGTPEEWMIWWKTLCAGDWMIYEEYDRRTNLRPHPQFGRGTGPVGSDWSPKTRGGVVDWRNTDNLRAMREVSVYLMAEETGSELVRKVFKERIRFTARKFLSIGNGEWDSPAYLSHTASAYLNLYDFAKDEEARLLAKAILDFVMSSAAIKYFDESFAGPNCRDYGTMIPHPGPASMIDFYLAPEGRTTPPENDIAHYATSAYRPPAAVVALARKGFGRPVEIFASHPHYQYFLPGNDRAPKYHETTWIAETCQMGSLLEGGQYDVNGCKILIDDGEGAAAYFIPSSQKKGNLCTNRSRDDRFAQNGNLLLCLHRPHKGMGAFNFLLPAAVEVEQAGDVTFLKFPQTWAAVRGINASFSGLDKGRAGRFKSKSGGLPGPVLAGDATESGLCGYVIELGEEGIHADYAAFKQAVLAADGLDLSELAQGKAGYTGATGSSVALQWSDALRVWRDGEEHDLAQHRALWRPADGGTAPISLGWKDGVLHVAAGGHSFTGTMDLETGTYSFTQELAEE
ncbi:MAG: hypothetical protein ACOCVS_03300 [Planctomycetota bacterium]